MFFGRRIFHSAATKALSFVVSTDHFVKIKIGKTLRISATVRRVMARGNLLHEDRRSYGNQFLSEGIKKEEKMLK